MRKAFMKSKTLEMRKRMAASVKKNCRFATLDFIFVMLFVNVFAYIFGGENSIVAVVFVVLMGCSMARDLTNAPIKHFLTMTFTMTVMTVAACYVNYLNPYAALPINLAMAFFILYSYTYEYAGNLYFPYILSYLFMIYITPVTPSGLPNRLVGIVIGCLSVMIYHVVMNRKHAWKHIKTQLNELSDKAIVVVDCLSEGKSIPQIANEIRAGVCKISRLVYERRKGIMNISDASFAAIDSARGLENLIICLTAVKLENLTPCISDDIKNTVKEFKDFINRKVTAITPLCAEKYGSEYSDIYTALEYVRAHMHAMYTKTKRKKYRRSALSLSAGLRSLLQFSKVRFFYALRVSILISLFILLVRQFKLPHGKWLLFTIASVSLPCADDIMQKAIKRMAATVIGGFVSLIVYSLISDPFGRTVIMMLSGYLGFYFAGYTGNYACATIGALGGAVYLTHFGWNQVAIMYGIRLMYIALGIIAVIIANRLLFPMKRKRINAQLCDKYLKNVKLLEIICCQRNVDTQLYYSLIIQSHMMEETLINALISKYDPYLDNILNNCRMRVRSAHRINKSPAAAIYDEYKVA